MRRMRKDLSCLARNASEFHVGLFSELQLSALIQQYSRFRLLK